MLEDRPRPHSPPGSSAATIPRPPSEHQHSMAEGGQDDEADEDKQDMPEQEQVVLRQSAQQPHHTTFAASAANIYGGQPTAPNYPIWLTPSPQPGDTYGNGRISKTKSPTSYQLPAMHLQATQSILQGNKQPWIAHKKENPPDHRARQPHTLAQAEQTQICAAVQLLAKSTTPKDKEHLARNNGCFKCRQLGHSFYSYPTFSSTPSSGQPW